MKMSPGFWTQFFYPVLRLALSTVSVLCWQCHQRRYYSTMLFRVLGNVLFSRTCQLVRKMVSCATAVCWKVVGIYFLWFLSSAFKKNKTKQTLFLTIQLFSFRGQLHRCTLHTAITQSASPFPTSLLIQTLLVLPMIAHVDDVNHPAAAMSRKFAEGIKIAVIHKLNHVLYT